MRLGLWLLCNCFDFDVISIDSVVGRGGCIAKRKNIMRLVCRVVSVSMSECWAASYTLVIRWDGVVSVFEGGITFITFVK